MLTLTIKFTPLKLATEYEMAVLPARFRQEDIRSRAVYGRPGSAKGRGEPPQGRIHARRSPEGNGRPPAVGQAGVPFGSACPSEHLLVGPKSLCQPFTPVARSEEHTSELQS